jgi:hypothetical protein
MIRYYELNDNTHYLNFFVIKGPAAEAMDSQHLKADCATLVIR